MCRWLPTDWTKIGGQADLWLSAAWCTRLARNTAFGRMHSIHWSHAEGGWQMTKNCEYPQLSCTGKAMGDGLTACGRCCWMRWGGDPTTIPQTSGSRHAWACRTSMACGAGPSAQPKASHTLGTTPPSRMLRPLIAASWKQVCCMSVMVSRRCWS